MIRFHTPFPNLASFSLGALGGLLIFTMLFFPGAQKAKRQHAENYGNALANTAAKRSIDAAFGNDLVGLRVILQDAANNPDVRVATVHDVESKLLVQAGELPYYPLKSDLIFTSEIVLQDSIAGYVTVVLAPAPATSPFNKLLIIIWFTLFAAIAAWSLWQHQAISFYVPKLWNKAQELYESTKTSIQTPQITTNDDTITEKGGSTSNASGINTNRTDNGNTDGPYDSGYGSKHDNEYDSDENTDDIPQEQSPKYHAYTTIHINNLKQIKQQLSGEVFRGVIDTIETNIKEVMSLYSGAEYSWNNERYVLHFISPDESPSDTVFRAYCAAHLICELCRHTKVPLDISTLSGDVVETLMDIDFSDGDAAIYTKLGNGLNIFPESDGTHEPLENHNEADLLNALQNRIELKEHNNTPNVHLVKAFKASYKPLLDGQYQQLVTKLALIEK